MNGCRVFIGRLSPQVRERDVEKFFKGYGRIREIDLKRGFGFVEFDDPRDADDAVYELNGKELFRERITVELAKAPPRRGGRFGSRFNYQRSRTERSSGQRYGPPVRTEYRLIVKNLSSRVSWQDLKDIMRQAGEVTFTDAHRTHNNEGIVEFASYSDLKSAIEKLDGKEINGRRIQLIEESRHRRSWTRSRSRTSTRSRSNKGSRSVSRSASRSRSRSRSPSRSPLRVAQRTRAESRSPQGERRRQPPPSRSPSDSPRKSARSWSGSREQSPVNSAE
ncbi:serine/arginine-rich splicing factor 5 [Callorhinchus milii]|nr:serine/arginine-rich splicing factor 5 [Callorhinchus milii]XP_007909132.1 serine/arginine-rich splicing factor 5 [Callorhinchus milii]|eukprot:gi/632984423/ref/XP_007909131.1/ PREDICTED: serine/arginine-rich splicing factor 5-like [Callorhinchus milii]